MIRTFEAEDQGRVKQLVLQGLEERWGSLDHTLNQDLNDIAGTYGAGRTVVAELDGQLIGTGTVVRRTDEEAEIVRMSVRADVRRRGLGQRITLELLATAREWGVDRVVLETSSHWEDVVAFYLRCGFRVSHFEDGPFGRDTWFELPVAGS